VAAMNDFWGRPSSPDDIGLRASTARSQCFTHAPDCSLAIPQAWDVPEPARRISPYPCAL
jgi:hypothetical protein